jgi:hypothetical protein
VTVTDSFYTYFNYRFIIPGLSLASKVGFSRWPQLFPLPIWISPPT